jgi:hypothetical protein
MQVELRCATKFTGQRAEEGRGGEVRLEAGGCGRWGGEAAWLRGEGLGCGEGSGDRGLQ